MSESEIIEAVEDLPTEEKKSLANLMNYLMPPEVVDMVRDKFGIKIPRGKIKFTDL